ncbi:adenosine deaminase [Clostridium sp. SHJSY1]|uniref:adenosine deaminase n=1 Tax=Clostridium sp. SHJSY1 TaxID=2942483 RepID=UPI00287555B9|nr:adenosine deaminase [Clostridium sp. SHJSY1]MDS0525980.1 adenosine deaminase [Clostridium sp. SHJSY1]
MDFLELPKIELHCHLDGSVRAETIIDIAKKENIVIPSYETEEIKKCIIAPSECTSLDDYLKAFSLPNLVMQSKESLRRITFELFEDAAKENVKYMEVRFAPVLHTVRGLEIEEIIESVIHGIKEAEEKYEISGNLILSCMRNMSEEKAIEVIEKGKNYLHKGVVAVDLCAGEEAGFCRKFKNAMDLARKYGYRITIHAGETGIGENVLEAVELLGAERIGHGVFIKDCPKAYEVVKEKNITLEMCPTSNVQTKAVKIINEHPIYDFYKDDIRVTINTDNRSVSDTCMSKEVQIISKEFDITYEDYKKVYYNSIEASFLDLDSKENLKKLI